MESDEASRACGLAAALKLSFRLRRPGCSLANFIARSADGRVADASGNQPGTRAEGGVLTVA